jgi:hypothetical protein
VTFPQKAKVIIASAQAGCCHILQHVSRIFEHLLHKRIGNTDYQREIVILEEGPFVFRVLQGFKLDQEDPGRSEWLCLSREAATEQALRCLHQSRIDDWSFQPTASSAA